MKLCTNTTQLHLLHLRRNPILQLRIIDSASVATQIPDSLRPGIPVSDHGDCARCRNRGTAGGVVMCCAAKVEGFDFHEDADCAAD